MADLRRVAPWGHFPHDTRINVVKAVTFRLQDALVAYMKDELIGKAEAECPGGSREDFYRYYQRLVQRHLDSSKGRCLLRNPQVAEIVQQRLFTYNHSMYELIGWSIMPNHVHLILYLIEPLSRILQRIKGSSSHEINVLMNTYGWTHWNRENFEREVESREHLDKAVSYLLNQPKACGFTDAFTGVVPDLERFYGYVR